MDFRRFFGPQKRREMLAETVPSGNPKKRRLKKTSDGLPPPDDDRESEALKAWEACRAVAVSLERMHVELSLEAIAKALPTEGLKRACVEVLKKVASSCERAVIVSDNGKVVFPPLEASRRGRGEAARTALVREALLESRREADDIRVTRRRRTTTTTTTTTGMPMQPCEEEGEEAAIVRYLRSVPFYEDQIAHVEVVPRREARFAKTTTAAVPFPRPLYAHQAAAIDAALGGKHVALCTGTASGKTLAYTLPALAAARDCRAGCVALFLFPTKALAQDQVASFRKTAAEVAPGASVACLDGDTPQADRETIRLSPPSVIVTNPDMLHFTLLPTDEWRALLRTVRYVVVDEAHVYVGIFGSHVAAVLRRLARLVEGLQFFCCSATISNPLEHAKLLLPVDDEKVVVLVDDDGSPRGEKSVVIWNPPLMPVKNDDDEKKKMSWRDPVELAAQAPADTYYLAGAERERLEAMRRSRNEMVEAMAPSERFARRRSSIYETAKLLAALVTQNVRTLAFARTRKLVELVLGYARDLVPDALKPRLAAYRGGYDKTERRLVEAGLFGGSLLGVVATSALELGVDVGDLDATLHLGHPGSIASLWQQAGRAGRRPESRSVAVVVCWDAPIDQTFARCGSKLLERGVEPAILDASNETVIRDHLLCAAAERPVPQGCFAPKACFDHLVAKGKLVWQQKCGAYVAHPLAAKSCCSNVNLRMIDPITFSVRLSTSKAVIDAVPYSRAFFELYEGAIYLHQAKPHVVTKLDLKACEAWAKPLASCAYHTSSRNHTDVDPTKRLETWRDIVSTGCVHVTSKVWGFRKVCRKTGKTLSLHEFSLPQLEMHSRATWIDVPPQAFADIDDAGLDHRAGIHALNHAILVVAPLFVVCDVGDLATEHVHPHQHRPRPARVIVYDARPGGTGVSDKIFRRIHAVLEQTLNVLAACPCQSASGCPACLHLQSCSGHNRVLDKRAAVIIVEAILRQNHPTSPPPNLLHPDDTTPRRRRRAASLKTAGAMDGRRAVALQSTWAPCLPDFTPADHAHE
ncbi:hypothetical protein CTAYLR_006167 [Chrysophaeum taylorii]|uniref:DEAD/DEAH box helicase n=1 Tax=Chrysophaeum taylorii TaxID=2483200 RepID=A0AAD7XRP6_9STRA|nr:hypothetical protein CTAYLR_006167 [Chrysophaeum taylorii]